MNNEIWKVCVQAPNYMVSNQDRVKCISDGKLLKGYLSRKPPYLTFHLKVDGKIKSIYLHSLVCVAFHGPKPFDGAIVMHKNDDYSSHRPDNLSWGTLKQNLEGAKKKRKILKPYHKAIILAYHRGSSLRMLSEKYDVKQSRIYDVIHDSKTAREMAIPRKSLKSRYKTHKRRRMRENSNSG